MASVPAEQPETNPDNLWPAIPAGRDTTPMGLLRLLDQTERESPARIAEGQLAQLNALVARAALAAPFYAERLVRAGIREGSRFDAEAWRRIPLLEKDELRAHGARMLNPRLHPRHGRPGEIRTSGSTGIPVTVATTRITRLLWRTFVLRDHFWHRRDASGKFVAIRYARDLRHAGAVARALPDWGPPLNAVIRTGPGALLNIRTPVSAQLDWLANERPDYLNTYPSNAYALAEESLRRKLPLPGLREVLLFGETAGPEVREACRSAWNVRATDVYTANEVGYIALQCPEHDHYHVQAENVYVEILDDAGRPCAEGGIGRVVVTALHNFAMPLLRYAIGDYAEAGGACPCGRGLPVIRRILGRTRNMLTLPNGERYWPQLGGTALRRIAPVAQQQFIQRGPAEIEARLVMERPATPEEEARLREKLREKLHYPFEIRFSYVDAIERGPTLKFEEFKSLL